MNLRTEKLEVERLYNALEEERITDAECARLRELLLSSPPAREEYIRLTEISVGLRTYAIYGVEGARRGNRISRGKVIAFAVTAAAAVFMLALGLRNGGNKPQVRQETTFAKVTWVEGVSGFSEGTRLGKGTFTLAAGESIGISIDGGTTLSLAGRARVDLLSARAARLHEGRARIRLGRDANGFSLETDEFRIMDLGTEFGVWAKPGAPDETHVIEGAVKVSGMGEPRVLAAGQSLSSTGETLRYQPGLFDIGSTGGENRQTALDRQRVSSGESSHDQRLLVHFPMTEESAGILDNESGTPGSPSNAVISGAKWVEGRIPGKPALAFTQPGDSVRLEIPGEFDAITLCAWVRIDSLPNFYNAIFTSDNFEPGNLHWQVEGTGGLNLGISWSPGNWEGLYSRHPVTANTPSGWIHLATTFDRRSGKCIHYLDGNPIVELTAKQIPGRKIRIGKASLGNWFYPQQGDEHPLRPWKGLIDSFMLYDAELNPSEISNLWKTSLPTN